MGHKSQHFYRKEAKLENPEGEEGVQTQKKKNQQLWGKYGYFVE